MKLNQDLPAWNKDGVWENVALQLNQKKKKRLLFWRFASFASVSLIASLFLWGMYTGHNKPVNKNTDNKSEKEKVIFELKQITEPIAKAFKKSDLPAPIINHSNTKEQRQHKVLLNNNPAFSKLFIEKFSHQKSIYPKTNSSQNARSLVYKNQASLKSKQKAMLTERHDRIEPLPIAQISSLEEVDNHIYYDILKANDPIEIKVKKETKISKVLWIESGLHIGNRTCGYLSGDSLGQNSTSRYRFTHTNTIGIQFVSSSNISIKTGLSYQTIYEKYDYTSTNNFDEEVFDNRGTIYNLSNGVTYTEPGIAVLRNSTSRRIIHNNLIHRLSVPIEIAYTLRKNKWSLEPSLGVRLQLLQQFNGLVTKNEDHIFDVEKINETYYPDNLKIGFLLSLNIKYNISQKSALGLRIIHEKDEFIGSNNRSVGTKYNTTGLLFGYYHSI